MADTNEKQANIQIEATPAGLVVRVEYTGALASIPTAIERLRSAGVLELVQTSRPAKVAQRPAQRVEPVYQPDGTPCCPTHKKPLREGQYGLYCSAKDDSTERGYCALKFKD